MYDFVATLPELERFFGTEAKAQSTFCEAGDELPPHDGTMITLMEVKIVTEQVARGRTRVERATPTRLRFLRLIGDCFEWRVPEEGYEGAWWEVPDHQLKVSSAVGAFVIATESPLAKPPYEYELERVQPNATTVAPLIYAHERPLVVGARVLLAQDGPWLVEKIDGEATPPRARCRRP